MSDFIQRPLPRITVNPVKRDGEPPRLNVVFQRDGRVEEGVSLTFGEAFALIADFGAALQQLWQLSSTVTAVTRETAE